ncbi:hypothetical protein [Terricaulis sp.]|uniref:hypothetical protein n=1 Tax=Terricaulis sp. TaxID=2768686 RepID=UPI002AC71D1F|nr:hypothetical protein [Terricaulis sp.]MDZ4693097.1 hypothetical protein [Terricaulis sp.]
MDETTAAKLSGELKKIVEGFNLLSELSMSIPDEAERIRFRRALGQLMVVADTDLIRPIARQYPHLDPVESKASK